MLNQIHAEKVGRYLETHPVTKVPDSSGYSCNKFPKPEFNFYKLRETPK